MPKEHLMEVAIDEARRAPWPFGAVIAVDGKIVAQAGSGDGVDNAVDPTAHAEVNAIRSACKALGVHDMSDRGAIMIASCEPCAMCMGAIWYAGIRKVIYGSSIEEEQTLFSWKDIAFPPEVLSELTRGQLTIEGGVLKEKVMQMYTEHSSFGKY